MFGFTLNWSLLKLSWQISTTSVFRNFWRFPWVSRPFTALSTLLSCTLWKWTNEHSLWTRHDHAPFWESIAVINPTKSSAKKLEVYLIREIIENSSLSVSHFLEALPPFLHSNRLLEFSKKYEQTWDHSWYFWCTCLFSASLFKNLFKLRRNKKNWRIVSLRNRSPIKMPRTSAPSSCVNSIVTRRRQQNTKMSQASSKWTKYYLQN